MPADGFKLKADDQAAPTSGEDDVLTATFPQAVESRFLEIASRIAKQGDALEAMLAHISTSEGKRLWRAAYNDNRATLKLVKASIAAVERG